ncbi:MAG: hypothetical protein QUV05_22820 [Phycisphaerae bacterium]|nr:hypothetical protein [Phycisphaerae bacterium]
MRQSLIHAGICQLVCLLLVSSDPALAQDLDAYGGYAGWTGNNTSGYFRVEKIAGRYYLITPDNHVFISLAFDTANYNDTWGGYCPPLNSYPNPYCNKAKYNGSNAAWEAAVKANMQRWGFNSLGGWCQRIANVSESVAVLWTTGQAHNLGAPRVGNGFADVYDPKFAQAADQVAQSLAAYANDRYRIGAFPDNELGWVGGGYWGAGPTLPECFIALPATTYGKQYWAGMFLPGKYATIEDLNAAYGTSLTSFTGSESTSALNVSEIPNDPVHPAIFEDKKDFAEDIADKYYSICSAAMRGYDPNHLVFSARWALWTTAYDVNYPEHQACNARIWKKAGQYCDIVAVNTYHDNAALEAAHQLFSRIFTAAGKPLMVTEWATWANDTQFAVNPGWRTYQRDRGEFYYNQMKILMDFSFTDPAGGMPVHPFLGAQWFQYYDESGLGRTDGEKANFGLFNVKDEPYLTALDIMHTFNSQVYGYLVEGAPLQLLSAPSGVNPANGSRQSPQPWFAWGAVDGAASYTLLISPEKCFPEAQTTVVPGITATDYTPSSSLAQGWWYWCVAATDTAGRSGKYNDARRFEVSTSAASIPWAEALGFENLAGWRNVSLEDDGWDGTAWAFRDTDEKTSGQSSARVVFTENSLNKETGLKNTETGQIVWQYVGPALYRPRGNQIAFDIRPERAVDRTGVMTVASQYVSLRVKDSDETIILDARIDPEGSLTPLTWRNLTLPLTQPHARDIASIEFYVDMSATTMNIPWDQRLTIWLDSISITPRNSRADFDIDFDVDQEDFGHFQACISGPGIEQSASACLDAKLDADEDVDRDDFELFAGCLTGPELPADPDCPH